LPFQKTEISGVQLFTPTVFEDNRGFFFESFKSEEVSQGFGPFIVEQVNNSMSGMGVIRGIHFSKNPPGQSKFVSVQSGSIYDVAIDLRSLSSTFGKWQGFFLSSDNNQSLILGNGIGHAFLSLEDNTRVNYLCDSSYQPEKEFAINPTTAGINWREIALSRDIDEFYISEKDKSAPDFVDSRHLWFD
jgi:dTDP-4-dehydrorhamnose 3,5-epimerase